MEEDSSSHVGHGDECHDDQRSNHESLSPCFKDEAFWICRLRDDLFAPVERTGGRWKGAHDL